jgi:hypothetical protein
MEVKGMAILNSQKGVEAGGAEAPGYERLYQTAEGACGKDQAEVAIKAVHRHSLVMGSNRILHPKDLPKF